MIDYFSLLKTITVNGLSLTDISVEVEVKNDISNYLIDYTIDQDETIYDAATKLYGDDRLFFLLYIANPGMQFNEPLTNAEMVDYLQKYQVTALQLPGPIPTFPKATNVTFVAYDAIDNTKIAHVQFNDFERNQIVLDSTLQQPVCYYLVDGKISNFDYQSSSWGSAVHHFVYSGSIYSTFPTGRDQNQTPSYTWQQWEEATNDIRRNIKVIDPNYRNDIISAIKKYLGVA